MVVHIHGGGFIATSSYIHQTYLRKIANALDAAVFCIDYPLAPTQKFSYIVDCVFKSYLFVRSMIENLCEFGEEDYEIILTGDSAGGNLACVLTNWLILNNLRVPKSLVLEYPGRLTSPSHLQGHLHSQHPPLLQRPAPQLLLLPPRPNLLLGGKGPAQHRLHDLAALHAQQHPRALPPRDSPHLRARPPPR